MPDTDAAVAGPTAAPIFHVHPLLRCNLRCLHCYSDSSPQSTQILARRDALSAIDLASAWGYRALAISGGEPLLYPGLAELLLRAERLGMTSSVVTNGLLLNQRHALATLRRAGTVTVSIDGLADDHDRMRGRSGAFAGARAAVCRLADAGIATWISCGVGAANLDDIEVIVDCAHSWGARGVNFHPVERAGRANAMPEAAMLGADDRLLLYTAGSLLAAIHQGMIEVHVDLLHRSSVIACPQLMYASKVAQRETCLPAQLLGVLVLSADGVMVPVCYGFDRRFSVGNITSDFDGDPSSVWTRFLATAYPALQQLGARLLEELIASESMQVLNPSEWLAARSHTFLDQASAPDLATEYSAPPFQSRHSKPLPTRSRQVPIRSR